jgi:2'-hydroxyisoflavone reductase
MPGKVLVAGGTGFLGGAIADAALAAGYDVSVLSRGLKATEKPGIHYVKGDRLGLLETLRGQKFDLAFDTCAFTPNSVKHLLEAIGEGLNRYVLISSVSVYGDWSKQGLREDDPVPSASEADLQHAVTMEQSSRLDAQSADDAYGRLKRACELTAEHLLGDRAISLRAGLLIGAGDYTDRMTWWVRRIDQGGKLPVPLPKDRPLQVIDVRDAAAFALKVAREGRPGIFNLTSEPFSITQLVETIQSGSMCRNLLPRVSPPGQNCRCGCRTPNNSATSSK